MRIGKLMIFVPDLEEAKRFYGGVLGLALKEEAENRLTFAHAGGELLAFRCERPTQVGDYSREARAVFVFEVDSVDAAMRELAARGVRFLHKTPAQNSLGRYAAFADPFGIVHEIFEPAMADRASAGPRGGDRETPDLPAPAAKRPSSPGELRAVLAAAPGPSPWYLRTGGPQLRVGLGALAWTSAGDREPFAGKTLLRAPSGAVLAIVDLYCYVRAFGERRFLVWFLGEDGEEGQTLSFHFYDAERLGPIADVTAACRAMKASGVRFHATGGEICRFAVPTSLPPGVSAMDFPEPVRGIGELLALGPSTSSEGGGLCIFVLRPREGTVEIVPQDWFNRGQFDFGYQWVTRVARDPASGRVVGEGIRLGEFILDASMRQLAGWLHFDPFHHPER